MGLARAADEVAATVIDAGRADVVVATETKLRPDSSFPHRYVVMASTVPMSDDELSQARQGRGGVAIMVSPRWRDYVHPIEIDEKGRYIIFTAGEWTVIGVYFRRPQDLPNAELREVLATIEKTLAARPDSPVLWCGDVNAHNVELTGGRKTCSRGSLLAREGVERFGLHVINPRDQNTFHRRWTDKQTRTVRPAEKPIYRRSIVDWMMVIDVGLERVKEVTVDPFEELTAGSDHRLVVMTGSVQNPQRLAKRMGSRPRWHVDRLDDQVTAKAYAEVAPAALNQAAAQAEILVAEGRASGVSAQRLVDSAHDLLVAAFVTSADATIGRKSSPQITKKNVWFWDRELRELARQRKNCYRTMATTNNNALHTWMLHEYQRINKLIKSKVRAKKRNAYQTFMDGLEGNAHAEFARKIRLINRARGQRMAGLPSNAETIAATERHFTNAFAGLPATDDGQREAEAEETANLDALPAGNLNQLVEAFSEWKVRQIVRRMARKKAPGKDGIPPELLRAADIAPALSRFYRLYTKQRCMPTQWSQAVICPIYKRKGSTADPANYRPIALLSVTRKVYEKCLLSHLRANCASPSILQGGFQPKRGTLDQIAALLELQRFQKARRQQACIAFLDIKGAYDSVARNRLWHKCASHGVNGAEMDLLRGLFDRPMVSVLVGQGQTNEFVCAAGIQQGSSLSPWLYTIYMNDLIGLLSRAGCGITIQKETRIERNPVKVPCLLFADDIVLTGRDWNDLARMLQLCDDHARVNRYQYGAAKCEVLRLNVGATVDQPVLQLAGQDLRTSDKFIYLGLPICASGIDKKEWKARAKRKANIAVANLRRLGLHRRGFTWQNSVYLYKTFVRPSMEYGLALIPPTRCLLFDLERIQMNVLRDAARARRNTSHGVLLRISGCTDMYQRARELADQSGECDSGPWC
jgi:exonuclease III